MNATNMILSRAWIFGISSGPLQNAHTTHIRFKRMFPPKLKSEMSVFRKSSYILLLVYALVLEKLSHLTFILHGDVIIDREAREIMYLVASVRPSVCPSVCQFVRPIPCCIVRIFEECKCGASAANFADAVDRLLITQRHIISQDMLNALPYVGPVIWRIITFVQHLLVVDL